MSSYTSTFSLILGTALLLHGCGEVDDRVLHYIKAPRHRLHTGPYGTETRRWRKLHNLTDLTDDYNSTNPSAKPLVINPVMSQKFHTCTGSGVGLYSWNHLSWKTENSTLLRFLMDRRDFACGDIYVNIADFTSPDRFASVHNLLPFIRNVRATGNKGVVYMTYGDINVNANRVFDGPERFARAFFEWFNSVDEFHLQSILPIGLSFDCEHLSEATIVNALTIAQNLKASVLGTKLNNDPSKLIVQWTVEGARSPANTDAVMRLADSAIVMVYRNHEGPSPNIDPSGSDTLSTRFLDYMMRQQCERCLDDEYASTHYKAKIKLMIESDCECTDNCRKTSFCAFDTTQPGWGNSFSSPVDYLTSTLRDTKARLESSLTKAQQIRLFGHELASDYTDLSLFVVHNWEWFNCYFGDHAVQELGEVDPEEEGHLVVCKDYPTLANVCRNGR